MRAEEIESRAVAKVVLVALFWIAVAVLLAIALLHTRTTLQWVAAAIFLALALDPAVEPDPARLAARRADAAGAGDPARLRDRPGGSSSS